ncbi:MAG: OmpA family protein [Cyclobacteriaceae bacterium]|nr:OmpA family protein [Cyclobacteriaceae bacterium]
MNALRILFLIPLLGLSSCIVTKKKYDDVLAQKIKAEGELAERTRQFDNAQATITQLNEALEQLKKDTTELNDEFMVTSKKLADLNSAYDQLSTSYRNLLNNSGKLNRDLAQQKDQLLAIEENLQSTRRLNDSLSTSLAEREKKVRELEQILANKDKAVKDLKDRISNALLNFKENDLTVKVKNGKVYVSLAEQLLFGSGSIEVDSKGVMALQQLARAIKDQQDLQIMIEGHTDNVPISKKSQYMQDNWDLSVMRATAITKILTAAGLGAKQVTAAGKGEYAPLAANDTPQNKQKNRRTEIIITPNLDELFKILGTN